MVSRVTDFEGDLAPGKAPPVVDAAAWLLAACFGCMAIPTLISLAQQVWMLDIGAHGPIVLAAGGWLIVRAVPMMRALAQPGSWALSVLAALGCGLLYAFGRAFDYISLEALGCYAMLWVLAYRQFGLPALRRYGFGLVYLAFLVPPPGWVLDFLTVPLRGFVSQMATAMMQAANYPIANLGVSITIGAYQLLVEDACSGMNSLVGLMAVALLYIHLRGQASWAYALLLAALILPLAVAVNVIRVVALILLTYHAGDGVAQGFLHVTSGLALFLVALVGLYLIDIGLRRILPTSLTGLPA